MKITRIVGRHVRIPLIHPAKWSGGTRHAAPAYVIEVHTDEGVVGLGECVGPTIPVIAAIVREELTQFLVGQNPLNTELLVRRMEEFARNWLQLGAYAIAGIEMALLDIKGKWLNTPVYQLLGGQCKKEVGYAGYLFIDDPAVNAKRALAYKDQGYTEIKLKVGRDLDTDEQTLAAIRDAVGWEMKIRVDANMNWNVPTAVKWIKTLAKYKLAIIGVSAQSGEQTARFLKHGANDFLTKPIGMEEFYCRVNQQMDMLDILQDYKALCGKMAS